MKILSYALVSTTMHVMYMFMRYSYVSLNKDDLIGVLVWARVCELVMYVNVNASLC